LVYIVSQKRMYEHIYRRLTNMPQSYDNIVTVIFY